ncbi:hypothetical protein TIFTF001_016082 [Ficus carica]|uniref:Uncharacterized protein n=1 Tax=Ficus carica TaxID=3494 RepID=A0AA88A5M6_FICCA|nr:hypothetical protein TIFTF001_016082 [Ficus carica]
MGQTTAGRRSPEQQVIGRQDGKDSHFSHSLVLATSTATMSRTRALDAWRASQDRDPLTARSRHSHVARVRVSVLVVSRLGVKDLRCHWN